MTKVSPASSNATPMPTWMRRRGQRATTPAPSHAPSTEEPIRLARVAMSTSTIAMKMKACATTGRVWPTCIVPGMRSSGTRSWILYQDVVGANDPIPSVSKKLVTNPMAVSSGDGSPAGRCRARRVFRTLLTQWVA